MPIFLIPAGATLIGFIKAGVVYLVALLVYIFSKTIILGFGLAIAKIFGFLGISYITFLGMQGATDYIFEQVQLEMSSLPYHLLAFMSLLKVDAAISIIFSAYANRFIFNGMWGSFNRLKQA